jgi:hypothetical protein
MADNPYQTPVGVDSQLPAEHSAPINLADKKRRILWMILIYAGVLGFVTPFLPEYDRVLDLLVGIPYVALGIWWCHLDAQQRDHSIGKVMRLCLVFLFAFALPVYLFQTRGLGGFKSLFYAGLFLAALVGTSVLATFAALCLGMMTGAYSF